MAIKYAALDIESIGTGIMNPLVWIISIRYNGKHYFIHDCFGVRKVPRDMVKIMEDKTICKVIQNASFDATYIQMALGIKVRNLWCTQSAEIVINAYVPPSKKRKKDGTVSYTPSELTVRKKYGFSLEFILPRYGFKSPDKNITKNFINRPKGLSFTKEELDYAAGDTKYLIQLQRMQEAILERDGQLEVALLENKTAEKIVEMRCQGISINVPLWKTIATKNEREYNLRLSKLPREVSNWGSEQQVKAYFKRKGILIETYDDLPDVYQATKNKVLGDFINARELNKAVTSYGLNWLRYVHSDGKLRSNIFQIKETGRMSYGDPNLQQLPRVGEYRSAIVASRGCNFDIGDFSGQEIGIMAAMADEKLWIDALLRGDDVHSLVASLLYAAEWESGYERGCSFPKKCNCTDHMELRENAKTLNFMLAYGGGPLKFSKRTGLTMFESKMVIKKYKKIIPRLTSCLEDNARSALNTGECYSADPYQRRRLLLSDKEWHIENQGKNSPIQAAGANMLKLAMISMPSNVQIAIVIHDEIITEQKISEGARNLKILKSVMEKSADYITGIKGLIKVDPRISLSLAKSKKK